jgi:hypothetical protein
MILGNGRGLRCFVPPFDDLAPILRVTDTAIMADEIALWSSTDDDKSLVSWTQDFVPLKLVPHHLETQITKVLISYLDG